MRAIGLAERALDLMCMRAQTRVAFGKPLADQGVVRERIAESRMQIEQVRLLTLKAAWMMDTVGKKAAQTEIASIKVVAARVATDVIDRAIQLFGGAGVTDDWPLASMYAHARTLHLVDGPDEVHMRQIAAPRARQVRAPSPGGLLIVKRAEREDSGRVRPRQPAFARRRPPRLARRSRSKRHGFDSLWLSERISGPAPDPVLGLTFAAARTSRIKLGTSVQVLPGRSPAPPREVVGDARRALGRAARSPPSGSASRTRWSSRRSAWHAATAPPIFDEALPLIRRLWEEDAVDHDGPHFHYEGMTVLPKPAKRLDVWLGGKAPSELRRVGKLADGWLASFSTPEDCKAGRVAIEDAAAAAGRSIDDDHFGAMVFYTHDEIPDRLVELLASRNPGADPRDLVAHGWPAVRELCERYVAVGFSKLVLVPFTEPDDWDDELAAGAEEILSIQN